MYFDIEAQIENNFVKINALLQFSKGGKFLIVTDSNARPTTWHDVQTNSGGKKLEECLASKQLHILNEESGRSTFHNSRRSSNIYLTITNNSLIAAVNEREISAEDSCSDHSFLKYKIGMDKSTNNMYNYQGIRYIVKEDKYHEFDTELVQEILKIFKNTNHIGNEEEIDISLSTIALKENDTEKIVDTFTAALQSACRETFKTISAKTKTKKKKSVP